MSDSGRVTGIGGVFFKCDDPEAQKRWYQQHLGLPSEAYGTTFEWRRADDPTKKGSTVWAPFPADTTYFAPSARDFMINYRVDNLDALVARLKTAGVTIVGAVESHAYGRFCHVLDPEGNKVELWEPNDGE
jgi:lactoylglutathione lyase